MKFYNFPYLVQKEILEQMAFPALIISGHISKKHKCYIQTLLKNRFKKIDTICYYSIDPDTCNISTTNCYERVEFLVMKPSLEEGNRESVVKMNMFGMELECSTTNPLTIYCAPGDGPAVLQKIHDYIYDFLGDTVAYEVRTTEGEYIPKLHHVTSSLLNPASHENLEEYFGNLSNHSFLYIWSVKFLDMPIRHFPNTEMLYLFGVYKCEETFRQFNGKQLELVSTDVTVDNIIELFKRWMSGDGYQNLEYLKVCVCDDLHRIFEEIEVKQFEEGFEPPVHPYWIKSTSPAVDEKMYFEPINFTSRHYLVRESDGHVAYLDVSENDRKMNFVVWNLTLEQLREYQPQQSRNVAYKHL